MDVRFCEGRNHRREAHVRAAGSKDVRFARSSVARVRRTVFSLDNDLHGGRPVGEWSRQSAGAPGPFPIAKSPSHHRFSGPQIQTSFLDARPRGSHDSDKGSSSLRATEFLFHFAAQTHPGHLASHCKVILIPSELSIVGMDGLERHR